MIVRNVAFFLISNILVLALPDQLQIPWQLDLIELLVLLIGMGATGAVKRDTSEAFNKVFPVGLLQKVKSFEISDQIFGLLSSFLSNRRLCVVLDRNSSQEYPLNAGEP